MPLPPVAWANHEVHVLARKLPRVDLFGEGRAVVLEATFIEQHHASRRRNAREVGLNGGARRVDLDSDAAWSQARGIDADGVRHRTLFWTPMQVHHDTPHAPPSRWNTKAASSGQPQVEAYPPLTMGWWPFTRRHRHDRDNSAPLRRDTRRWLSELRDACERCYDRPEAGRILVRELQVEWRDAHRLGVLDDAGHLGLERRAYRLLNDDDDAWLMWLDHLAFWQPGWTPEADEEQA